MSKYTPGQAGPFRGKMGQTVISSWRGIKVGKAAPKKSTKLPTLKQANQRSKFALMIAFLKGRRTIIKANYPSNNPLMTPMNLAVKYHLKNAVIGVSPNFAIDYSKVQLSDGPVEGVTDAIAVAGAGKTIEVSWTAQDLLQEGSSNADLATFYFYSPALGKAILFEGAILRTDLKASMNAPNAFSGDKVHGYMFLRAVDGKTSSKTEYLGLVTLPKF